MTISVCVVVNDGLVLASDSATTLRFDHGEQQVYNNADKIFNLYKGLPIGAATWGMGSIGRASMATLSKDFRRELMNATASGADPESTQWVISKASYTIEEIAGKFRDFLSSRLSQFMESLNEFNNAQMEKFEQEHEKNPELIPPEPAVPSEFYFRVAGYDANAEDATVLDMKFNGEAIEEPVRQQSPISWGGMTAPVERIVLGLDSSLIKAISKVLDQSEEDSQKLVHQLAPHTEAPLWNPAMPIMDAIDLAEFLVETATKFYRFYPGAPVVGGPIETATIMRHEGFKWIRRKHFYDNRLNPNIGD